MDKILEQVKEERERQDAKWGGSTHDDEHAPEDWIAFIDEHVFEAENAADQDDLDGYRKALVEVAALCVAALEAEDRLDTKISIPRLTLVRDFGEPKEE